MTTRANGHGRRLKKGERNRRRAGRFFVPDHSSFYEELGEEELARFAPIQNGRRAPHGWLADGRPYVKFLGIGETRCCEHYWIDPTGLEKASATELGSLLGRSAVDWPDGADADELEVNAVWARDDGGRSIWDIQVTYPAEVLED